MLPETSGELHSFSSVSFADFFFILHLLECLQDSVFGSLLFSMPAFTHANDFKFLSSL